MKYVIDEIIADIAILENLTTKEKKEINISFLPNNVKEGNVLIEEENFRLDKNSEANRRKLIQDKLNKLKRGNYE